MGVSLFFIMPVEVKLDNRETQDYPEIIFLKKSLIFFLSIHENTQLSTYRISLINPPATPIKIQKIEQKLFLVKQKIREKNLEKENYELSMIPNKKKKISK
jgi:hypothetical protein